MNKDAVLHPANRARAAERNLDQVRIQSLRAPDRRAIVRQRPLLPAGIRVRSNLSCYQLDDSVTALGESLIMGDQHQSRGKLAVKIKQQFDDPLSRRGIQIARSSSANRILASVANARAMATRCCSPPDSWLG